MSLVPNDVKNEWKNVATLLNSSSGGLGVVCTLIFEGGVESTADIAADNVGIKPRVGLSFGGRSPARTITGQLSLYVCVSQNVSLSVCVSCLV